MNEKLFLNTVGIYIIKSEIIMHLRATCILP